MMQLLSKMIPMVSQKGYKSDIIASIIKNGMTGYYKVGDSIGRIISV